jgi:hypothetical protein
MNDGGGFIRPLRNYKSLALMIISTTTSLCNKNWIR